MTIAEKIIRAKQDYDAVSDAAYDQGLDVGYKNGHDAGYKEGEEAGLNAGGYTEGFEAGEDAMWDMVQNYGNRTDYSRAFKGWSGEYIRPKYKVVPTGACGNMIYSCPDIKKIESAYFDLSQSSSPLNGYDFATCGQLEEVEDIGLKATTSTCDHAFAWDYALRKVAKIELNHNVNVTNLFYCCYELEDVTIVGVIGQSGINLQYSTKLNKGSIESFVNALSEEPIYASGKSITFSKTAVNREFRGYGAIPDYPNPGEIFWGDGLDGEYSLEWMNLITSKTNAGWTINLI